MYGLPVSTCRHDNTSQSCCCVACALARGSLLSQPTVGMQLELLLSEPPDTAVSHTSPFLSQGSFELVHVSNNTTATQCVDPQR